jgi:hypothetical protein
MALRAFHKVRRMETKPYEFKDNAALGCDPFAEPSFSGEWILASACAADPFPAAHVTGSRAAFVAFTAEKPVGLVFPEPERFEDYPALFGHLPAETLPCDNAGPVHVHGLAYPVKRPASTLASGVIITG